MIGLETLLTSTATKKIIDLVASYIPLTNDQKTKLELELSKVEVESLKVKSEYVKSLGTRIRDAIIPCGIALYFIMQAVNFFTAWYLQLKGAEPFTIAIDTEFTSAFKTIIVFLFGYKGSKYAINRFTDK